jgi:hypothetical protein
MDEHARRILEGFLSAVDDFNNGRTSLLDLSSSARSAASALDNASAPLPKLLDEASTELEYAYFTSESKDHDVAFRRILAPILALVASD